MGRPREIVATASEAFNKAMEQVRRYFEIQLIPLGLSEEQIVRQTLGELEQSLETVNDALKNPESFGVLPLRITAEAGAIISRSSSEAQFEVGILPILLERKRLILDRIRLLVGQEKIENLQDKIKSSPDNDARIELEEQISKVKEDVQRLKEQDSQRAELEEKLSSDKRLEFKFWKDKAETLLPLLERESVATIVGSLLLVVITFALLIAMFLKLPTTEIVNNSFLVLLGYFFGQTISKVSSGVEKDS
jgi:hypothetical protein